MSARLHKILTPHVSDMDREAVCSVLRRALAEAEAGEIDTVMVIAHHTDGGWSEQGSATRIFSEAIGRLEVLKYKWIRQYLGG